MTTIKNLENFKDFTFTPDLLFKRISWDPFDLAVSYALNTQNYANAAVFYIPINEEAVRQNLESLIQRVYYGRCPNAKAILLGNFAIVGGIKDRFFIICLLSDREFERIKGGTNGTLPIVAAIGTLESLDIQFTKQA